MYAREKQVCTNFYGVVVRSRDGRHTHTPFYEDGQAAQDYFDETLISLRALKVEGQVPLTLLLINGPEEIKSEVI